jgi:hypothetical protein
MKALLWALFAPSAWAQPATVVVATRVEGAPMASDLFFGVGSASHCVGGHDI